MKIEDKENMVWLVWLGRARVHIILYVPILIYTYIHCVAQSE